MIFEEEDLDKLSIDELNDCLAKLIEVQKSLVRKKKELSQVRLKYDIGQCWIVGWINSSAKEGTNIQENIAASGGYRQTNYAALSAAIRRTNANIIEAYAEQIEPEWVADWTDLKQEKCNIVYDAKDQKFGVQVNYKENLVGTPIMSLKTAHIIKRMLNEEKITLRRA
jgi:hypothetical protein